jgi:hypothetical protein
MSVANVQVLPVVRLVEEVNLTMMLGKQFLRRLLPPSVVIRLMSIMHYRKGEPELRILKSLVDPKKNSIDIGANKGVYIFSTRLSRQVLPTNPIRNCKVIAHLVAPM